MDSIPGGLLNGVGAVGVALSYTGLIFWLLATGRLCTGRELREKDKRIQTYEKALNVRDEQITAVLTEYLPAANSVMQALHRASDEVRDR